MSIFVRAWSALCEVVMIIAIIYLIAAASEFISS